MIREKKWYGEMTDQNSDLQTNSADCDIAISLCFWGIRVIQAKDQLLCLLSDYVFVFAIIRPAVVFAIRRSLHQCACHCSVQSSALRDNSKPLLKYFAIFSVNFPTNWSSQCFFVYQVSHCVTLCVCVFSIRNPMGWTPSNKFLKRQKVVRAMGNGQWACMYFICYLLHSIISGLDTKFPERKKKGWASLAPAGLPSSAFRAIWRGQRSRSKGEDEHEHQRKHQHQYHQQPYDLAQSTLKVIFMH